MRKFEMMGLLRDIVVVVFSILFITHVEATGKLAKSGCPDKCGNVTIPYPFGIGKGCYHDEAFSIECRQQNKPLAGGSTTLPVLSISLEGQLRVSMQSSYNCYTGPDQADKFEPSYSFPQFVVSDSENNLTTVGCNSFAALHRLDMEQNLISCVTQCALIRKHPDKICSGRGCCQVPIQKNISRFNLSVFNMNDADLGKRFYKCSYAFLVEKGQYGFSVSDIGSSKRIREYPVVLDWSIGKDPCSKAMKNNETYACKSLKSRCYEPTNGGGYRCSCSEGYAGNPYLPNGCQDIDECKNLTLNDCIRPKTCQNLEGSYMCDCPKGHLGDGRRNGRGCVANVARWTKVVVGITTSLLALLLALSVVYWVFMQKRLNKLGRYFFEQNGGVLLREKLAALERSRQETKIFSQKDLEKATNNYHESRIIGRGGQGIVYKGILPGNRAVAIKKAKIGEGSQIEQFVNEVIVLSQINHRNVVKLLGCCLETEVPLLVYEFVTNGSLFDHMHNTNDRFVLSWKTRLRIACETAEVLSYLHSAASIPIIHRDIKSANILLDDSFRAKVSDFGASRMVPADQEQLTTLVQGTLGYLDPEYFQTSHLNEKSDVYSFGVVLLELITGEKPFSFTREEKRRYLVTHVTLAIQENRYVEVLDKRILDGDNMQQLQQTADLAMRCVKFNGKKRPLMKVVAAELEALRDAANISTPGDEGYGLVPVSNQTILDAEDT